jgi:tight adherence protein C
MNSVLLGGVLGLGAAAGVAAVVVLSPPMRRPRIDDRIAPYLYDALRPSRLLVESATVTPFPTLERMLGPALHDLAGRVDRLVGGTASVRRRLDQSGRNLSVEQFRVEQVLWGAAGLGVGLLIAVLATTRGSTLNPLGFLVLALVLAFGGVLIRDRALTSEVARREARMVNDLPVVAEMLALSVGAGEGPTSALDRVVRLSSGDLSDELGRALSDARAGVSVVTALDRMAARASLPPLGRFVDGMAIALERGTPLADVLRAQAADVRETARRALLESAGRKEIAMLVPVVFFVLPVTVIFALFPGFYSLRLAVP